MSLIAHKNTAIVPREAVLAAPAPEFTPTWHPHSHGAVLNAVELSIAGHGMETVKQTFSMDKEGYNMFGVLELDKPYNGANLTVGVRNSVNKAFSVGVCAGSRVFVCDNLAFSAQFIALRKHTSGLDVDQLVILAQRSVGKVVEHMGLFAEWHTSLKENHFAGEGLKAIVYDLMKANAFAPSQFRKFLTAMDTECGVNGDDPEEPSLYSIHGACTRLQRGYNLFTQHQKNLALNGHLVRHVPMPEAPTPGTEVIDVEEVGA